MGKNFEENVFEIKKIFSPLTAEQKYEALIRLGKNLPPLSLRLESQLVRGCQSALYLQTTFSEGKLFFNAHSDALISKGLAAILILAYSGLPPEILLTSQPNFLHELGFSTSLSPSRSNGLAHIHLRMKQEALQTLIKK